MLLYSNIKTAFVSQFASRTFTTSSSSCARAYKSVVNRQIKQTPIYKAGDIKPHKLYIPKSIPQYPEYPYGEARIFKRSDHGLYGGQTISFGNNVSEMGNRSRRTWLPNVITKRLWSESLNRMIRMRLTARVLKVITKEGGLDAYVTKDKSARVKELGLFGWRLRYDVLKAREEAAKPPNFETVKLKDDSEVKVYFKGDFNGAPIQLTIGKRKLIQRLFPVVKLNTPGDLTFSQFNSTHCTYSIARLLKKCEALKVDLSNATL